MNFGDTGPWWVWAIVLVVLLVLFCITAWDMDS